MERVLDNNTDAPRLANLADVLAYEQEASCEERFPITNSYALMKEAAARYGDDLALQLLPTGAENEATIDVSYNQLLAKLTQTANMLSHLGAQVGDPIAIMLTNMLHSHYAIWGAQVLGVAAPLNPVLDAEHLVEIVNTAGSKFLITMAPPHSDSNHWARVEALLDGAPQIETLIVVELPGYTQIDFKFEKKGVNVINYDECIGQQPADHLIFDREIRGDDVAAYFHTGGTTGRPKIAQVTHHNIAWSGQVIEDLVRYRGRFPIMSALPMFHIYGLIAAGIGTLFAGRSILIMTPDGFRNPNVIKLWWHHAARYRIVAFAAVPTILAALLQLPAGDNDLSCLQDVGSGAAPLPKQLRKEFENTFDVRVSNGWGMTETCSLGTRQIPESPAPEGSVGARFPYCELRIVELDGTNVVRDCDVHQSGVLILRGPNIFKGYLNPEDNAKAWVDGDWFNTGDVAYVDSDGFVTLTGRAKDLIIRGGHNIDPVTIEEPLLKHAAVAQVVAIGQPDAYAGELPVAYVELKPEFNGRVTEDELLAYCQDSIAERAAIPKRIEFVKEMPMTVVGKFFKPELRNRSICFVLNNAMQEQGIFGEVSAEFDQARGHVATVKLHKSEQHDLAREVLERFPVVIDFC
ncbi:acyl-CoA synthetase [Aurantivibrio plasticivorans]